MVTLASLCSAMNLDRRRWQSRLERNWGQIGQFAESRLQAAWISAAAMMPSSARMAFANRRLTRIDACRHPLIVSFDSRELQECAVGRAESARSRHAQALIRCAGRGLIHARLISTLGRSVI